MARQSTFLTHTSGLSGTQLSPPAGTAQARPWQVFTAPAIILVEVSIAGALARIGEEYLSCL
jgi:hypothetical protein